MVTVVGAAVVAAAVVAAVAVAVAGGRVVARVVAVVVTGLVVLDQVVMCVVTVPSPVVSDGLDRLAVVPPDEVADGSEAVSERVVVVSLMEGSVLDGKAVSVVDVFVAVVSIGSADDSDCGWLGTEVVPDDGPVSVVVGISGLQALP